MKLEFHSHVIDWTQCSHTLTGTAITYVQTPDYTTKAVRVTMTYCTLCMKMLETKAEPVNAVGL